MAKGDTYRDHLQEPLLRIARAEQVLFKREGVSEEMREYCNALSAMVIALMHIVEEISDEGGEEPTKNKEMSLYAIQQEIGEWSRRTFPKSTTDSTIRHLWTEMVELDRAFTSGKDENCREEVADLFILLVQLCNRAGIDLQQAVRQKHEENLNRQWDAPDKHGVVYHTKGK